MRSPAEILAAANTIAIVGASPNPDRPSHGVMRYLLKQGYRCIPVRPLDSDDVLGVPCVATLADIDEPIDVVDVFRRSDALVAHAHEAVEAGAGALWLQLGLVSAEARDIATNAGLDYVEDECTAIVHRREAPVRDSGPVEGVWGNREVPPATRQGPRSGPSGSGLGNREVPPATRQGPRS